MTSNERIAHDILCVAKYGSRGGQVYDSELKRMVEHLESAGLVKRPQAIRLPVPTVRISVPAAAPVIRLP